MLNWGLQIDDYNQTLEPYTQAQIVLQANVWELMLTARFLPDGVDYSLALELCPRTPKVFHSSNSKLFELMITGRL